MVAGLPGRHRQGGGVVAQDRQLDLPQSLAGVQPEVFGQLLPVVAETGEGVRGSTIPVQREHQVPYQPLPQRVAGD